MSVRLPLEGDEGMEVIEKYLTFYSLAKSLLCAVLALIYPVAVRHLVQ